MPTIVILSPSFGRRPSRDTSDGFAAGAALSGTNKNSRSPASAAADLRDDSVHGGRAMVGTYECWSPFARVNSAPENGVIRKVALLVNRIAEALLAGFFLHIAHVGLLLLQL